MCWQENIAAPIKRAIDNLNKFFMTQKFKLVIDFPPLAGALLQGVICSWGLFIRIKF